MILEKLQTIGYRFQTPLFYFATLLYFLLIGGFFRQWWPWLAVNSRFLASLAVLIFITLLYWFFKRTESLAIDQRNKILLLAYLLTCWLLMAFISVPWIALVFSIAGTLFLWWVESQIKQAKLSLNSLILVVVFLGVFDIYSLGTFFDLPAWMLAALMGVLFAGMWLLDPPVEKEKDNKKDYLIAVLATVFLGIQAFWLSQLFPWTVVANSAFLICLFLWLATGRFLERWSWLVSGVFWACLLVLFFSVRWF